MISYAAFFLFFKFHRSNSTAKNNALDKPKKIKPAAKGTLLGILLTQSPNADNPFVMAIIDLIIALKMFVRMGINAPLVIA